MKCFAVPQKPKELNPIYCKYCKTKIHDYEGLIVVPLPKERYEFYHPECWANKNEDEACKKLLKISETILGKGFWLE